MLRDHPTTFDPTIMDDIVSPSNDELRRLKAMHEFAINAIVILAAIRNEDSAMPVNG